MMSSVSVVTRLHSCGHRLDLLAAGVAAQDMAPAEWHILDAGPQDVRDRLSSLSLPVDYRRVDDPASDEAGMEALLDAAGGERIAIFDEGDFYGRGYLRRMVDALDRSGQPAARLVAFLAYSRRHRRFGHWDQRITTGPHVDWAGATMRWVEADDAFRRRIATGIPGETGGLVIDRAAWREHRRSSGGDRSLAAFLRGLAARRELLLFDDRDGLHLRMSGDPPGGAATFPQSILPDAMVEGLHPELAAFARRAGETDAVAGRHMPPSPSRASRPVAEKGRATVGLNMIVRNEAHVIERCLRSVMDSIDYWVIVDTGSTDGTQDRIREILADIPGELHERPWVDFGHNRGEALALIEGRSDYILFIDADETLKSADGARLPELTADAYEIEIRMETFSFRYPRLVRAACGWKWKGVLHEYLEAGMPLRQDRIDGVWIHAVSEGARSSDPHKYRRDALVFEQALIDEPDNARYMFYLGQSYRDCDDTDRAIDAYRRRVAMGGWYEEVFQSKLQIGLLLQSRGDRPADVAEALIDAHAFAPHRAEPLYWLGQFCLDREAYAEALLYLSRAAEIPFPASDLLFVDQSLYDWRCRMMLAVAAYWTGDHARAVALNNRLLQLDGLPDNVRRQITENRNLSLEVLGRAA
ncbi:MAG: glycosyltransferase [Geminicoccaceae bacterium]|nr:glycosyltransferase [Geminicoccaceae bacterium]